MHAKGLWRPSATTNSFIVRLNGNQKSNRSASAPAEVWSSFGQPCENEYKLVDWHTVEVNKKTAVY
jgi:hypothetical protein